MPQNMVNRWQLAATAPYLPWADGTGRPLPRWTRLPLAAPFGLGYPVVSWAVYWSGAYRDSGPLTGDGSHVNTLLFHIPELTESLWSALQSALPAVFLHHDTVQLLYVSSLLLLFGLIFEVREGSARAMAVFFGASFAGTLVAGALLHLIYPDLLNGPGLANAWERGWGGGSVGCFGLMGAMAARARLPWLLLGCFVVMELCIADWSLAAFTPVMHFAGLLAGFLIASWWRHE